MLLTDVTELACPSCRGDLSISEMVSVENDRELIAGTLRCAPCRWRIRCGRHPTICRRYRWYNPSWNYKWTTIDRGRGLNHLILDKWDPAYELHDLYDRNSHGGSAFAYMRGRRAIEIGCGVGQYVIKSLHRTRPGENRRCRHDRIGRHAATNRHRSYSLLDKRLLVQGSVFSMPFRPGVSITSLARECCIIQVTRSARSVALPIWCGRRTAQRVGLCRVAVPHRTREPVRTN